MKGNNSMGENAISQARFADLKGVSRKTVTMWKNRGLLVMSGGGLIDVAASDQRLKEHGGKVAMGNKMPPKGNRIREQGNKPSGQGNRSEAATDFDYDGRDIDIGDVPIEQTVSRMMAAGDMSMMSKADAETMKENYLARLRQLQYDRESGTVADIDEIVAQVSAQLILVRNRLMSIGARVAPRVAVMRGAEEVKALIDQEVRIVLNEICDDPMELVEAAQREMSR